VIAGGSLRGLSLWRQCPPGEREVSVRASGEALDRGLVTLVSARLRSAAKPAGGWDPWSGVGVFRAGREVASPTVGWRAGEGLAGVLVGELLGVAARPGCGVLRVTLAVDGDETTRELTVEVAEGAAGEGSWVGRAAEVTEASARGEMVARLTAWAERGRSWARSGGGRLREGARATALWQRAEATGRAVSWWASDGAEGEWVLRAEGDAAALRVTAARAEGSAVDEWGGLVTEGAEVARSSPWVEFGREG
jgi:hypothetical protein